MFSTRAKAYLLSPILQAAGSWRTQLLPPLDSPSWVWNSSERVPWDSFFRLPTLACFLLPWPWG